MPSYSSILLLASLASSALAAPAEAPQASGSSFTVPRVQNPNHNRNGTHAIAKAYRKYGFSKTAFSPEGWQGHHHGGWSGSGPDAGPDSGNHSAPAQASGSGSGFVPTTFATAASAPATAAPDATVTDANDAAARRHSSTVATIPVATATNAPSSGSSGSSGVVSATGENGDSEYVSPVSIGGQTFNLVRVQRQNFLT